MQAAEEGDDDGGEAVAGRDRRRELADRPRDLEDTGETGKRATQQQCEPGEAFAAEPAAPNRCIAGSAAIPAIGLAPRGETV